MNSAVKCSFDVLLFEISKFALDLDELNLPKYHTGRLCTQVEMLNVGW